MATKASNPTKDAAATFEAFTADAQKAATEQMTKLSKGFEEATVFGQENIDAVVKSSEIAVKAAEGINSEVANFSKKTFEDGVAAAKDFTSAKNVTELFEKQSSFMQTSFEGFFKQATKMNEMMAAAAKDLSEPLNARVSAATQVMKSFNG